MQKQTYRTFFETPRRVDAFLHLHDDFALTRGGVSYNLFFPNADYIEQNQSKVQTVVWNEIAKSLQRVTTSRQGGLCPKG
jgi:hypothetical protein